MKTPLHRQFTWSDYCVIALSILVVFASLTTLYGR